MSDFVPGSIEEQIEALIDKHGLLHVLTTIELLCAEKAEHIQVNWQDRMTARAWDNASKRISKLLRTDLPL